MSPRTDPDRWSPRHHGSAWLYLKDGKPCLRTWLRTAAGGPYHYDMAIQLGIEEDDDKIAINIEEDGACYTADRGPDHRSFHGRDLNALIVELDSRLHPLQDRLHPLQDEEWERGFKFAFAESAEKLDLGSLDEALEHALGEMLRLNDGLSRPMPSSASLAAAAGYLLPGDAQFRRLGRSMTLNVLPLFMYELSQQTGQRPNLVECFEGFVQPVTDLLAEVLGKGDDPWRAELRRRYPAIARDFYLGDMKGWPWIHAEVLARIEAAQAEIGAASITGPPQEVVALSRSAAGEGKERLIKEMSSDLSHPEAGPSGLWWGETHLWATHAEAIADSLLDSESRALTASLYSGNYVGRHLDLVREVVGEFAARPVLVASHDRWMREIGGGRGDPLGVHIPRRVIFLKRRVGADADRDKDQGWVNAVLIHELIHGMHEERRTHARPPYDPRTEWVESKLAEGLTEHFTERAMEAAAADGSAPPGLPSERYGDPYSGFRIVCERIARTVSQDDPEGWLKRLSRTGHRLSMVTIDLLGDYTRDRKEASTQFFKGLLLRAESWTEQRDVDEATFGSEVDRAVSAFVEDDGR